MPELGSLGSVRGALRNERPYRERYIPGATLRNSFGPRPASGAPQVPGMTSLVSGLAARFPPEPPRSRSRLARAKRPRPSMMSTVEARVEMGARYHGGACLGSLVGRQAPPVYLGRARRSERVKPARFAAIHESGAGAEPPPEGAFVAAASWGSADPLEPALMTQLGTPTTTATARDVSERSPLGCPWKHRNRPASTRRAPSRNGETRRK